MLFMQLEDRSTIIISLQRPAFFLDSRSDAMLLIFFHLIISWKEKSLYSARITSFLLESKHD